VKKAKRATWQREPLSSEGASYGDGADKMPAHKAVKVPAKEGTGVLCRQIQHVGSGRWKARQRPRSTNRESRVRVTIF